MLKLLEELGQRQDRNQAMPLEMVKTADQWGEEGWGSGCPSGAVIKKSTGMV